MRIAYLSGRGWRGAELPEGRLPSTEQSGFERLAAASAAKGLFFEIAHWQDEGVAHAGFDGALIRSCWDYVGRPEAFLAALERLEAAGLRVLNPSSLVRWNLRKTYLRDLAQAGTPTIDTLWLDTVDATQLARAFDALDAAEIVLKPQIGAGSAATLRLKRNAWSPMDLLDGPQAAAMVQPFLPAVASEGEASLHYAGGAFTHAVLKRPPEGDWRANAKATAISVLSPTPAMLALAETALASAPEPPAYARVDLVPDGAGWRLIELELIEPFLYLDSGPDAAERFAAGLARAFLGPG